MSNSLARKLQKRKAIVEKLAHLSRELADLDQELFPRIETLVAAIDGYGTAVAIEVRRRQPADRLVKIAERLTLAHAAQKVLLETKRPMKTGEIYEELVKRGIQVNGKMPQNNLAAHLSHHDKVFVSTTEGWQLRQGILDAQKTNAQAAH